MAGKDTRIVVIGAGVVGLSTAVRLQDSIPDCHVTVIADKFTPDTTSDGAAGIFRPTADKTPGVPLDIVRGWLRESWDYLSQLAVSDNASDAGMCLISGYQFLQERKDPPLFAEFVYSFKELSAEELQTYPGPHKFGWSWTTVLCESRRYLPYLTKRFLANGGTLQQRKLNSLLDTGSEFDIIVNCAGFGNKSLTNDVVMVPIRGHLIRVEAPWVKHFVYNGRNVDDFDCYIIPGRDCLIVGGTRQEGDEDLKTRQKESEVILRQACEIIPSLKKGRILEDWVGLRPHRSPLRLETEMLTSVGRTIKVVHNYGHGAEGVSLAWGTAGNAVRLVQELLSPLSQLNSKL